RVVLVPVVHGVRHQLHVPQGLIGVLLGHPAVVVAPVQVVVGVGLHRLDFKQVPAGAVRDVLGHLRGVARGGVVHHQHIAAGSVFALRSLTTHFTAGGGLAGDFAGSLTGALAGGAFRSGGLRGGGAHLGGGTVLVSATC